VITGPTPRRSSKLDWNNTHWRVSRSTLRRSPAFRDAGHTALRPWLFTHRRQMGRARAAVYRGEVAGPSDPPRPRWTGVHRKVEPVLEMAVESAVPAPDHDRGGCRNRR